MMDGTTQLSFGPCAKCGLGVTVSSTHVLRRKVQGGVTLIGPETDVYHLTCVPPSLITDAVDSIFLEILPPRE